VNGGRLIGGVGSSKGLTCFGTLVPGKTRLFDRKCRSGKRPLRPGERKLLSHVARMGLPSP